MSLQRVRNAAQRLLVEANQFRTPVNVEAVARHLSIPVFYKDLGDVSAMILMPSGGSARIVVNRRQAPVRQRFSIAHEIGHAYLAHQFAPGEHVHVDRGTLVMERGRAAASGTDPIEIEANAFAAALLMPRALVEEALDSISGDYVTEIDVDNIAEKFEVSPQALQFHLQNLRLVR